MINNRSETKMHISELPNIRRERGSRYSSFRTSYYTRISFEYGENENKVEVKIDTGSPYTIIGTGSDRLNLDLIQHINNTDVKLSPIENVSGGKVNIKECIVDNFKLTLEIILPKVKIFFSDDIQNKAVLGMDLLSLFDFNYAKRDKTFYLHYRDGYINALFEKMTNMTWIISILI